MPTPLGKNLHLCFPKIKQRSPLPHSSSDHHLTQLTKDHNRSSSSSSSSTTSSSSSVLIKNFNSLYDLTPDSTTTTTTTTTSKSLSSNRSSDYFSSSDSEEETTTPDFATVYASQRFFFSSPGRTNSIVSDSPPPPPPSSSSSSENTFFSGGVPIPTFSPDPYSDFRRSMQEMVESRDLIDVTANWDYLNELLVCYLALNPKDAHQFIIRAFADLIVSLMAKSPSPLPSSSSKPDGVLHRKSGISDQCKVSRQLL